jgi:RNA polymerase sigma factor (sigma-70 family)
MRDDWFLKYARQAKTVIRDSGVLDRESIEDVLQNVWIKLLASPPSHENAGYIKMTARNAAFDYLDSDKRHKRWADEELARRYIRPLRVSDSDSASESELYFNALPDDMKAIILMRATGKTIHEIAEETNISYKKLKTRILRCQQRMRRIFPDFSISS